MNDKINTLNILSQKEFSSASGAGRCGGKYEKNSRESLHISNMFLNFASSETKNDGSTLIKVLLLALFLAVGKGVAWAQVVAADDIQQLLRQMKGRTARQVVDTFSQMVATHRNGAEPNDDLTMLAIRCL